MGLKKFFRSEKEMSKEEAKEFLQTNGVVVKDDADYYKRKFKFQEFGKLVQDKPIKDNTLRPVNNSRMTAYGDYDDDYNPSGNNYDSSYGSSNQGYGYDAYTSEYSPGTRTQKEYRAPSSTNTGRHDRPQPAYSSSYSSQANDERKPKNSRSQPQNYNSYSQPSRTSGKSSTIYGCSPSEGASQQSIKDIPRNDNKYGYEPSISNYNESNGYGFDPYEETSVVSKAGDPNALSKVETSNTTVTKSTYDPFAPGEEPYGSYSGYGGYEVQAKQEEPEDDDQFDGPYGNSVDPYTAPYAQQQDAATITDAAVNDAATGMQALQLQEEQKQKQEQEQNQGFDPYGPTVSTQTDLDLNDYQPAEQAYDEDEFEEDLDEDEEELNRIQRQTKDVREDTVQLSRQLVDNLVQANDTATNTLGVLGSQREKIYEMQNNIGTMKVQQRFVDDHVKDLEHYNRSLFHIKVSNPFTRNSRRRAKDQAFLAQRQEDRSNKDRLNKDLLNSQKALINGLKVDQTKSELQEKYDYDRRVKEAAKYLTKDHDEEDERMEVEIGTNIDQAQKFANHLKKKAEAMNLEIQQQNRDLNEASENVDHLDDKIVMTTRRIRGI
ncbi:unnamed protein product [Pichia kudriavzevii]